MKSNSVKSESMQSKLLNFFQDKYWVGVSINQYIAAYKKAMERVDGALGRSCSYENP